MNDTPLPPHPGSTQPGSTLPGTTYSDTEPKPDQITRFFDWIRASGLNRDGDRWFAGVCGGIAARTGLDPLIVRGIAVVLAILGGPVIFAYAVGWALLPRGAGRIYVEDALRGRFQPAMIAIGALLFFTIVPIFQDGWWRGPVVGLPNWLSTLFGIGWSLALLAGIGWLVVYLVRRRSGNRTGAAGANGSARSTGSPSGRSGSYPMPGYGSTPPRTAVGPASAFVPEERAPATNTASATESRAESPAAGAETPSGSGTHYPSPYSAATYVSGREKPADQNNIWQEQHLARQAARRALVRARRPGTGFTSIVLGLALATGAVAAMVNSRGVWSNEVVLLGLAFALGVLAVGIVIAGIRGRTDGAMGGFALLAAVVIAAVAVFPPGTQFSAFGTNVWALSANTADATETPGYAMIAGQTILDLRDFDNPGLRNDRTIDVWLGAGETKLILPADAPVRVETHAVVGGVDYSGRSSSSENGERNGLFTADRRTFNAGSVNSTRDENGPVLRIWTLAGLVTLTDSND
ncbi:MAG: PspC domain-containing protein [Cryobacterium sp.]|uniref:PspC domain-containing protein n=1 Tax=unclassified Cryobacterium TaxID=2649013 RepID=UPI0018C8E86B|nr:MULTISPECIES: PspC domain-containing protein [unclassified Cryobacterium]MCY7403224.1 PspC domain-containing protein [Cryobacterium sp.]MEC5154529.1 phage shock protein PspC (stress-responsive transcriptional regulator) [Cryobacterium sp. CAN_C3]